MPRRQCADVKTRPTEVLDFTRLTRDAFQPPVPPCEAACHAHLARGSSMGHPGRRVRVACTSTAPCRRRKTGSSSCART
jgi:hypothetical protein